MPAGVPLATYRVQFSPGFGFEQASTIPGYLENLGVDTLYASPVWEARKGSRHGYDVTDPARIREELGGQEAFLRLARGLQGRSLGLLLDIVPNHMAATSANAWWCDVLEHGPTSPYAKYFDIDWDSGPEGRLVLPVLGRSLDEVAGAGEISIEIDATGLWARYHGGSWPLEVSSYPLALAKAGDTSEGAALLRETGYLPAWRVGDPATAHQRRAAAMELKHRWIELLSRSQGVIRDSRGQDEVRNASGGDRAATPGVLQLDRATLRALLDVQAYALVYWRDGLARINYRRFFDISDLAGLRVEEPEVFDAVHRLPLGLIEQGLASGLRIDHIDGLSDPAAYLQRLTERLRGHSDGASNARRPYLIVEKILDLDEELPEWPVDGTTGYEFINTLNGVFVDPAGIASLHNFYREVTGDPRLYAEIALAEKLRALRELFVAEGRRLAADLARLTTQLPDAAGVTREQLHAAILLVAAGLPVYRTYVRGSAASPDDIRHLRMAFETAPRARDGATPAALRVVEKVLAGTELPHEQVDEPARQDFVMRWQQLTGPAAAKGEEDTALFSYTPFVSLNEVGGDPSGGRCSVDLFHALNKRRAKDLPRTLNATTTHDTKRSEDVRARLNVISELAPGWMERTAQWMAMNAPARSVVDGREAPGPSDELLFYQTLAGIWPLEGGRLGEVESRICEFMIKASREAKKRSSWISPNEAYEAALTRFVGDVLHGARSGEFAASFLPLQKRIEFAGAVNSLSQVVFKVASPGVPDFYQGSELWDFSLTDPDNRRPVAFDLRALEITRLIEQMRRDRSMLCNDLLGNWRDGRVKLFTTAQALRTRGAAREVLQGGRYEPVQAEGERAVNVCAFARASGAGWILAVAPRLVASLNPAGQWPLGATTWGETDLVLPEGSPSLWGNAFTGRIVQAELETRRLPVASVLSEFPVALLRGV